MSQPQGSLKPNYTMINPSSGRLDTTKWADLLGRAVIQEVSRTCQARGECSMMLTGGRSAARLYSVMADLPAFIHLANVRFYFGDERCLSPDHPESNYGLALRTLFRHGVPPTCEVIPMEADHPNPGAAATTYEGLLPERLDVLLLSIGEDGHIASLFPRSPALFERNRRVVHVLAPKKPFKRLTVTPSVIIQAHKVFVMAIGRTKASLYKRAQLAPQDISDIPARLALNASWYFSD